MLNIPPHQHGRPAGARADRGAAGEAGAPTADVVSEAGRQKTIEVFGEPLTPMQVVERICRDVRTRGLEAVLEYTAKLDGKTAHGRRAARAAGGTGGGPRGG